MTADLNKLNGDQTIAEQTADLAPIEKYVATKLPVIPTTTSAEWCEYTSSHYTGWPTQSEPVRERASPRAPTTVPAPAPTSTSCCTSSRRVTQAS